MNPPETTFTSSQGSVFRDNGDGTLSCLSVNIGPMPLPPLRGRGLKDTFTTTEHDAGRYERTSSGDE